MMTMAKDSTNLHKPKLIEKLLGSIRKMYGTGQQDKRQESDAQMLARIGRKFVVLFFVILMFGDLLDLLLGFFQFVYELIHLFSEAIEYALEVILEYALYTDHHQSETIIANAAILITLYGLYRFFRGAHGVYVRNKRNFLAAWIKRRRRASYSWRALPLHRKIKLVAANTFGTVCLLFLLTL